mmetsp:Transcript_69605/g.201760  ORF Transcript_69605/g.201760 Transcript_69605/m.201760 type:complete len:276 (-) Transcript_69605:28-855(-)
MIRSLCHSGSVWRSASRGLLAPLASFAADVSTPGCVALPHGPSTLRASRRGFAAAVLIVDGAKSADEVLAEVSDAVGEDELRIIAVGQKGVMTTLPALARLERPGGLRPTFTVLRIFPDEVHQHAPRSDFYVDGKNNYRLVLPSVSSWEDQAARDQRTVDARLFVSNKTEVPPLAKAIAARCKMMPLGRTVMVETSLAGSEAPTRLRVSRLVHAVSRAYGWQVNPQDLSRPTRTFCCAVATGKEAAAREGAESLDTIRVEVIPNGPVGGTVLSPA